MFSTGEAVKRFFDVLFALHKHHQSERNANTQCTQEYERYLEAMQRRRHPSDSLDSPVEPCLGGDNCPRLTCVSLGDAFDFIVSVDETGFSGDFGGASRDKILQPKDGTKTRIPAMVSGSPKITVISAIASDHRTTLPEMIVIKCEAQTTLKQQEEELKREIAKALQRLNCKHWWDPKSVHRPRRRDNGDADDNVASRSGPGSDRRANAALNRTQSHLRFDRIVHTMRSTKSFHSQAIYRGNKSGCVDTELFLEFMLKLVCC